MINQLVNQRYEVVEKIGDSPLFAVYKARDNVHNRVVALKSVHSPYDDQPAFLTDLRNGLAATANLKHPNIAQFGETGMEDGTLYAVVEYVRGINLKERVRRIAPFSLSVAIDYACALGDALYYAHSAGQAHGDLRPENIIISPEGAVKITDFGTQSAIARNPQALTQIVSRSAYYKAPELSFSQSGTPAGDLYAMGAILYEMLTGTTPYTGDNLEAVSDQHAYAAIPSPRAINPGVPRSVEGIIIKCLQKKPDERYRSASELLNDLKSVRDALRFGKSLSWTPIDIEKAAAVARPSPPPPASVVVEKNPPAPMPKPTSHPLEPIAEVAASSRPVAASTQNKLRKQDESLSFILKALIAAATIVIFFCLVGFAGIWMTRWVVSKPEPLPVMVGKNIDEIRAMAKGMKIALREHAEYMDRPRNIVYKTDPSRGDQIRPGHVLNVWYSRGSIYVNVPNVANLQREDAEQKLKDAGLTIGKVTPEFSDKVPKGAIIGQDVSSKKRVLHDTAVDLTVSDGPKPDYADTTAITSDNSASSGGDTGSPTPGAPDDPANLETHVFDRSITIRSDGLGTRQVRIEYVDADGEHTPVIDEPHAEGDKVPLKFEYRGKKITLRAYYNDEKKWEMRDLDPEATKHQRIDSPGGAQ